jgi:beta-mannosidase
MKHIFCLFFTFFAMMQIDAQSSTTAQTLTLPNTWEFRQANKEQWYPVTAPISAHTALLQNKLIDDPFYRDNEDKLQWIEKEDWEFRTTFQVDEAFFQKKHLELIFKGLDTYAHVYVNDSLVLESDNMFRGYTVDVKKYLKKGENHLSIYFESAINKVDEAWKSMDYELPGGVRTMTRKAQFHYGWDWGPRFVGCGILNLPVLQAWEGFILDEIFVTTEEIAEKKAKMMARFRYRADFNGKINFALRVDKRKNLEEKDVWEGAQEDSISFDIIDPKLWWCQGMGEAHLYPLTLEAAQSSKKLSAMESKFGIRTIQLITDKDANGEQFHFKLNGKSVFCKGANYIPQHIFQDKVTSKEYVSLINDVCASNINMLRVWGGGIYEQDLFYDLCDARGILVWQDFMYACAMYPGDGKWLQTAAQEALEQVIRLRKHPCMALWCGNNENNEAWKGWGWQMKLTEVQRNRLWRDYQTLFNDLLPTYVTNHGAGLSYWESSPLHGRFNPKSTTEGDSHYWGVWHDEEPFSVFNKKVPRFMSEFGFQSFPEWRTIQSFTTPEERFLDSKVMLLHQKHPRGNALIAEYMKRDYKTPKDFEQFVYVSQLLQAEGMRTGIEAHRRNKPHCMGTLYWQLNDVWPVASWSSRDNFGRWKALQYYVQESFTPLAALPFLEDDVLKIYGVNDTGNDTTATLIVKSMDFDGNKLSEEKMPNVHLSADSSKMIWQTVFKSFLKKNKSTSAVTEIVLLSASGDLLYRRLFYANPVRELSLPKPIVKHVVNAVNNGYEVTVWTDKLAKNVYLQTEVDGFFQDNYFDLLPGEQKKVLFKTQQILAMPDKFVVVKSLVDTY